MILMVYIITCTYLIRRYELFILEERKMTFFFLSFLTIGVSMPRHFLKEIAEAKTHITLFICIFLGNCRDPYQDDNK